MSAKPSLACARASARAPARRGARSLSRGCAGRVMGLVAGMVHDWPLASRRRCGGAGVGSTTVPKTGGAEVSVARLQRGFNPAILTVWLVDAHHNRFVPAAAPGVRNASDSGSRCESSSGGLESPGRRCRSRSRGGSSPGAMSGRRSKGSFEKRRPRSQAVARHRRPRHRPGGSGVPRVIRTLRRGSGSSQPLLTSPPASGDQRVASSGASGFA